MTLISKNVYRDKLDDIVNKYNNKYHSTIKMKPVDLKSNTYINLVILLKYQNIRMFLQQITLQIGVKKFLWLKKLKALFLGHIVFVILTEKKLLERFMKTIWKKKTNQREFRIEEVIKKKGDKLCVK